MPGAFGPSETPTAAALRGGSGRARGDRGGPVLRDGALDDSLRTAPCLAPDHMVCESRFGGWSRSVGGRSIPAECGRARKAASAAWQARTISANAGCELTSCWTSGPDANHPFGGGRRKSWANGTRLISREVTTGGQQAVVTRTASADRGDMDRLLTRETLRRVDALRGDWPRSPGSLGCRGDGVSRNAVNLMTGCGMQQAHEVTRGASRQGGENPRRRNTRSGWYPAAEPGLRAPGE